MQRIGALPGRAGGRQVTHAAGLGRIGRVAKRVGYGGDILRDLVDEAPFALVRLGVGQVFAPDGQHAEQPSARGAQDDVESLDIVLPVRIGLLALPHHLGSVEEEDVAAFDAPARLGGTVPTLRHQGRVTLKRASSARGSSQSGFKRAAR